MRNDIVYLLHARPA